MYTITKEELNILKQALTGERNKNGTCLHCGADNDLHQSGTNKCPKNGRELSNAAWNGGKRQQWEETMFEDKSNKDMTDKGLYLINKILESNPLPELKHDIDRLYNEIDFIARDYNHYEYGLPLGDDEDPHKKEIIKEIESFIYQEILKNTGDITLEKLFKEHKKFAFKQFPESTWVSSLRGLEREIKEVENCRDGLKTGFRDMLIEYADCFMYLMDSMNRVPFTMEEFKRAFAHKLQINKERDWKKNEDNSYSHIAK